MTRISLKAPVVAVRRTTLVVLVVLVVLAAGLTTFLATRSSPKDETPTISKDGAYHVGSLPTADAKNAVEAAVATLPVALSYDYRDLAKGLAGATSHMTTTFGAEFAGTFNKTVKAQATQQKAVANALVRGAGLVSLDGNSAVCVVYVNQVLASSKTMAQQKSPVKLTQSRVLVGLSQQAGKWLVDSIEPF
jgi:predicted metal-binding membrane protein